MDGFTSCKRNMKAEDDESSGGGPAGSPSFSISLSACQVSTGEGICRKRGEQVQQEEKGKGLSSKRFNKM